MKHREFITLLGCAGLTGSCHRLPARERGDAQRGDAIFLPTQHAEAEAVAIICLATHMEKIRARPGRRRGRIGLIKVRSTQAHGSS
jgi:hypothetical protein